MTFTAPADAGATVEAKLAAIADSHAKDPGQAPGPAAAAARTARATTYAGSKRAARPLSTTSSCWRHHHTVHEGGHSIDNTNGEIVFRRPDGTAIANLPAPIHPAIKRRMNC